MVALLREKASPLEKDKASGASKDWSLCPLGLIQALLELLHAPLQLIWAPLELPKAPCCCKYVCLFWFVLVKQEDCAVIKYPGEVFLGHLVSKGGKAVQLAESLKSFADEREVNLDDLVVVFADGCIKMGGFKHVFTAEFKNLLGRPVLHVHGL